MIILKQGSPLQKEKLFFKLEKELNSYSNARIYFTNKNGHSDIQFVISKVVKISVQRRKKSFLKMKVIFKKDNNKFMVFQKECSNIIEIVKLITQIAEKGPAVIYCCGFQKIN